MIGNNNKRVVMKVRIEIMLFSVSMQVMLGGLVIIVVMVMLMKEKIAGRWE